MQSNESFRLVVRRGPQPNQSFELNKDIITLGRDITNDIVINDPEVSRHHLRITRTASGYNLEDLGSTNGTFIGGQRLTGVRALNRGDLIGLGETVTLGYEVVRPQGEAPPTEPPANQPPYSPPPASNEGEAPQAPNYAPPQQQSPPSQQEYAPPQPQQDYNYQQQQNYAPPQQDYNQQQQQDYGYQQYPPPAGAGGYDYDPYAVREEEGGSALRWILIGCGLLTLFCCCISVVGIVVIDALSLWYDLPIISDIAPLFEDIANSLGLI